MSGNGANLKNKLFSDELSLKLSEIYADSPQNSKIHAQRYVHCIDQFESIFGENRTIRLFSAPGRTEIGGNHTDHQRGRVLAASVNLDTIAAVSENGTEKINIQSEGYDMIHTSIHDNEIRPEEFNTTLSLIKGIVASFQELGYPVSGFDAYICSNVLKGSGLSSSAAFEVLIGTIINSLFCQAKESAVKIAQIGQRAENVYFGKPSGLMDQTASSVGSFVTIDFKDAENPIVEKVNFDFAKSGYSLCIVDGVGDHADLTDEYASIPIEMKSVAKHFGKEVLSEIPEEEFYKNIAVLRQECGDRAVLRCIHFYQDNKRVPKQVAALNSGNFEEFKKLIVESGYSSYMYLQNVYASSNPQEQCLSIALAISEKLLKQKGAYRVHGGGFAGTIQAFVPNDLLEEYKNAMENIFGKDTCHILSIRPVGGIELIL